MSVWPNEQKRVVALAKRRKRRATERRLQPASAPSAAVGNAPAAAPSPRSTPLDFPTRPDSAPALRLMLRTQPRSESLSGSARALACGVPRPRGTPENANIFYPSKFSNASRRPARARVETREGACAPRKVAERLRDGSRGLQPTVKDERELRRVATAEIRSTETINRRYATNNSSDAKPWPEAHSYHRALATRGNAVRAEAPIHFKMRPHFANTPSSHRAVPLKVGAWNLFGIWCFDHSLQHHRCVATFPSFTIETKF